LIPIRLTLAPPATGPQGISYFLEREQVLVALDPLEEYVELPEMSDL
jgi:hypothetical protein